MALVVGGIVYANKYVDDFIASTKYEAPKEITVEVEKEVSVLDARIKSAQESARPEIETKAQAAYDDAYKQAMLEIELRVRKEAREEDDSVIESLEKEVGVYWRDKANVRRLIMQTFPEQPQLAVRIATGESGLNPTICGPHNNDGTKDCGLWQINDVHVPEMERLGLDRLDPEDATKFARILYDRNGGWSDWVYYNKYIALR